MVNIWSTTTQFILIGMAAFCISFGVIYSLIFCYKSRRKNNYSEENERLRDELMREKFIARRKSTSLTSPPLSDSVVNPNYNASPYKVPTRHLRSTSASYSPTHYLSPHHRRNSTPTQAQQLPISSTTTRAECSCCGAPRGITKSKSGLTSSTISAEHSISITSPLSSSNSSPSPSHLQQINCLCSKSLSTSLIKEEEDWDNDDNFLSTHKCKLIPVLNHPRPTSKLALENEGWAEDSTYDCRHNQKSFSFGPIPAARRARKVPKSVPAPPTSPQNTNANPEILKNSPTITFTTVPSPTFTTTQAQTNINLGLKQGQSWDEKEPLLNKNRKVKKMGKLEKVRRGEKNDENEYEKADKRVDFSEDEDNHRNEYANNNEVKRKVCYYKTDAFRKKSTVLEEGIPYYIEQNEVNCN